MAPEEAIFLTMLALLSAGDHVICTFPGYQSLYEVCPCHFEAHTCWRWERLHSQVSTLWAMMTCTCVRELMPFSVQTCILSVKSGADKHKLVPQVAKSSGCRVDNWDVRRAEDGRLRFDPADLKRLITVETRLVVINFPHNPTGGLCDLYTMGAQAGYRLLQAQRSACFVLAAVGRSCSRRCHSPCFRRRQR